MLNAHRIILLFVTVLQAAAYRVFGQGIGTTQSSVAWTCVCDPGGFVGSQVYTGDESQGFTECSCSSECPLCPAGQVLDPLSRNNDSCACVSPLFLIVRLLHLRLSNYTVTMEDTFINDLASSLYLSPSQVIPVSRRNGSVILDMYIISTSEYLKTVKDRLLRSNSTLNGAYRDSPLGPWDLLYVRNISSQSDAGISSGKRFDGKLLLLILVLLGTIAVTILLTSLIFVLYHKRKILKHPSMFWLEKDDSSSGCKTLISHRSSPTEEFQVYDNTCFNGSTGCIGRRSFKISSRKEPLLGTVTKRFSYADLQEATGRFSKANVIGIGGSSSVYHGQLKDGREVAIKRLTSQCGTDLDREFLLEVELLSRLHHFHLVPLVGYCIETRARGVERLLVYEYMPNGNLREHLNQNFGKETLNWTARLRIALGAARGLEYLHEAADPRVLHRDFKSSNILLDAKWRAKVADFGMATTIKELDCNACPSSPAQMLGTFGYFAPEYAMVGRATVKSDVFSFGVVLLELISGHQPVDKSLPPGQESLVIRALPLLRNKVRLLNELVDPALQQGLPMEDIKKMAHLAWLCLQTDPESRPTMTSVVQVLASLIPENVIRMNDFGPLMESRDQAPQLLSWSQDYSFSRDENPQNLSSNMWSSTSFRKMDDQCKSPSQRWCDRQTLLADREQETMFNTLEQAKQSSLKSTSLSAAEYLQKFTAMATNETAKRSTEEESLDLVKPRLEYFWQNNGLVVQVQSPAR